MREEVSRVVSQELLDILRCPNCVREGPEAGLLDHDRNWLICTSCDRKYPIRDDIPVMLIEEGDRYREVSREELPDVPPAEAPRAIAAPEAMPPQNDQTKMYLVLAGLALGAILTLVLLMRLRCRRAD